MNDNFLKFYNELREIELAFFATLLKQNGYNEWPMDTFDIDIRDDSLILSIEGADKDDKTMCATQKVKKDLFGKLVAEPINIERF